MPRPKKIKSPEDFGKQFEELKKTIPAEKKYSPEVEVVGKAMEAFCENPNKETEKELFEKSRELGRAIGAELAEKSPLEELQELEKKLRACTDETPRDIRYKIECNRFILVLQYNSIEVRGDVFYPEMLKGIYIDSRKSELATAQKMHEVLKEWQDNEL